MKKTILAVAIFALGGSAYAATTATSLVTVTGSTGFSIGGNPAKTLGSTITNGVQVGGFTVTNSGTTPAKAAVEISSNNKCSDGSSFQFCYITGDGKGATKQIWVDLDSASDFIWNSTSNQFISKSLMATNAKSPLLFTAIRNNANLTPGEYNLVATVKTSTN
ncbi:hypothetical protein MQ089_14545 [Edwardsiella anguillarum]|uniref:hypothetical protein n=1 Tax=Edwardsiella anguillarum TaxID=1821960 RepID=UPI0024B668C9|nr:hypothetical protein [Edwardsiella anguillarum]WHP79634.1 hypothetical protein MQ090_14235 [Edwardsiella anguillarum]WHQ17094.1 hypothetical protein MQ085_14540 [Edwardsiella anguillarum]WHQ20629.1 hypothetical protein MQ089_14545 [Edwardsiella anguillarum]WHQ24150.1 hypothetical protein MQ094_14550 [Edwardsiella anguillarum]WHQ27721.1 hypothetical protein MQ093_14765 [Edwardsiella anguillarum]